MQDANQILISITARQTQTTPIILLDSCLKTLGVKMDAHDA